MFCFCFYSIHKPCILGLVVQDFFRSIQFRGNFRPDFFSSIQLWVNFCLEFSIPFNFKSILSLMFQIQFNFKSIFVLMFLSQFNWESIFAQIFSLLFNCKAILSRFFKGQSNFRSIVIQIIFFSIQLQVICKICSISFNYKAIFSGMFHISFFVSSYFSTNIIPKPIFSWAELVDIDKIKKNT